MKPIDDETEPEVSSNYSTMTSPTRISSKPTTHKILYPLPTSDNSDVSSVTWSGLTAFDMVQQIAKMAIGSTKLEQCSVERGYSLLQYLANEETASYESSSCSLNVGQKRKREAFDDDNCTDEPHECSCEIVSTSVFDGSDANIVVTRSLIKPWKPSVVLGDWFQGNQSMVVNSIILTQLNRLSSMVVSFEQLSSEHKNKICIYSYGRVQSMFLGCLTSNENALLALDQAIRQMQVLLEIIHPTTPIVHGSRVRFSEFVYCHDGSKQLMAKPNPTRIMNGIVLPQSPLSDKAKRKVFNAYLTEWLCQIRNWVNPYPDEIVLQQMAKHFIHLRCIPGCDDTVTEEEAIAKIYTWFLNIRSRQWRPAVEEAFDGKRPALLLMEDSLRIFKGDKLRPVIGWDSDTFFANRDHYSKPVATWGEKDSKATLENSNGITANNVTAGSDNNDLGEASDLFPEAHTALMTTLIGFGLLNDNSFEIDYEDNLHVGEA